MKTISVASIKSSGPHEIDGETYSTRGYLRVKGDDVWLVPGQDADEVVVPVCDPSVVDRLLDSVPCYLGGKWLYNDEVQLEITLSRRGSEWVVSLVHSGMLFREDEQYSF